MRIHAAARITRTQCYQDYCVAYKKFLSTQSQAHLQDYYDAHNSYVQQLHATNGMIKLYQIEILPRLLEEIQESYLETSATIASSIQASTEMLASKVSASTLCESAPAPLLWSRDDESLISSSHVILTTLLPHLTSLLGFPVSLPCMRGIAVNRAPVTPLLYSLRSTGFSDKGKELSRERKREKSVSAIAAFVALPYPLTHSHTCASTLTSANTPLVAACMHGQLLACRVKGVRSSLDLRASLAFCPFCRQTALEDAIMPDTHTY